MARLKSNISLKKLNEQLDIALESNDEDKILKQIQKIIDIYPKNHFGYIKLIKYKTNNYKKYITDEDLKIVKDSYEMAYKYLPKKEKTPFKKEYDEYLHDIKEVNNLIKIKKNIVSKYFLKELYSNILLSLNINKLSLQSRIQSGYNLVNGIFLLFCLVYNLIYRNAFLIITIPLGIFGVINILSFLDKKNLNQKIIDYDYTNEKKSISEEIKKIDNTINFYEEEKNVSLTKIPASFHNDINGFIINNEEAISKALYKYFYNNNYVALTTMLEENTNLKINDINKIISNYLNKDEKLHSKKKILYVKKINKYNYVVLGLLLLVSIATIIFVLNNRYMYRLYPFLAGVFIGIIKMFIYKIEIQDNIGLNKVFLSITKSVVFSSSLIYDITYMSTLHNASINYMLLKVPLTFFLLFSGLNMVTSYMKYNKLLKKIRKS